MALALMALGGHGVISVTANVAPAEMAALCRAALAGDLTTARRINRQLLGLHLKLFVEANPIPVKWALNKLGRIESGIRMPMTPLDVRHHAIVQQALERAKVLA